MGAPDLFRGNPALQPWFGDRIGDLGVVFGSFGMIYRLRRHYNAEETVDRDIFEVLIPFLKSKNPTSISVVGFCYGGWIVPKVLEKANDGYVTSAVCIHPAWNIERSIFRNDIKD